MKEMISIQEKSQIDSFIENVKYRSTLLANKKVINDVLEDYSTLSAEEFHNKYTLNTYTYEGLIYFKKQINKALREMKGIE